MANIPLNFGGSGVDTDAITATADKILSPYVGIGSDGEPITGTIPTKAAATINPSTVVQTVAAGQYLGGILTIAKVTQTNLTAGNIKSGVTVTVKGGSSNIYSVAGTYQDTIAQTNLAAGNIKKGVNVKVTRNGSAVYDVTGTWEDAITYSNLSAGNIKNGVNVLVKRNGTNILNITGSYQDTLTQTNLSAGNIKKGVTITIKRNNANVWSVTGTWEGYVVASADVYKQGTWGVGTRNVINGTAGTSLITPIRVNSYCTVDVAFGAVSAYGYTKLVLAGSDFYSSGTPQCRYKSSLPTSASDGTNAYTNINTTSTTYTYTLNNNAINAGKVYWVVRGLMASMSGYVNRIYFQ